MARKHYYMVLDTETANSTEQPFAYDIGFAIVDRNGNIYETASFVISDIFDFEQDLMKSAYYANKIPMYLDGIKSNQFKRVSLYTARMAILDAIKRYNVKAVCAYNAAFDINALNTTQRWTTKSKYRYFLPYGLPVFDIWNMACQLLCTQKHYIKFCFDNGFVSDKGNINTNAEKVWAYLTQDEYYAEQHTGLADVLIESAIMAKCFSLHKKMNKGIDRKCWRIPQEKARA